jgi:hypothetical protein
VCCFVVECSLVIKTLIGSCWDFLAFYFWREFATRFYRARDFGLLLVTFYYIL